MSLARTQETKESGPIQKSVWDTRTKENSEWCDGCNKWLRLALGFGWLPKEDRLKYHQTQYCKNHPEYQGDGQ